MDGGHPVVIHTGALLKRTRPQALDIAKETLRQSIAACDDQGFGDVTLCPETMGKINQLGDLDEVLELCQIDGRLLPCIDFGHLYARSLGADDGAEVFARMLDKVASALGEERASRFHSHFSRIEFTPRGGEKCPPDLCRPRGLWAGLAAPGGGDRPPGLDPHLYLRERRHPGRGRPHHERHLSGPAGPIHRPRRGRDHMNHLKQIAEKLPDYGLDAMLITSEAGERYAIGFHGEGLLLITRTETHYTTDGGISRPPRSRSRGRT